MSVLQARMHLTVTERRVGAPRSGQEESVAKRRRGGGAAAAATGLVFVGLALVHALRAQRPKRKEGDAPPPDEGPCQSLVVRTQGSGRKSHKVHWVDGGRPVLRLEVTSGAQAGHSFSLPPHLTVLNVGRVGSNDFVINDTEVSSQHARIAWDDTTSAWQLMDLGSLNGTRLNGQAVGKPDRECGAWHPLAAGDVIHFGERDESPAIAVSLLPPPSTGSPPPGCPAALELAGGSRSSTSSSTLPCGAAAAGEREDTGVAGPATRRLAAAVATSSADSSSLAAVTLPPPYSALLPPPPGALAVPVAVRQDAARGRPCEDRSLVEMPLRGHPDVALLCVFDGHCGGGAAQQASDLLPGCLARELSQLPPGWRASPGGAGPALRAAFLATDAAMRCEYEGCAATAVLMWRDGEAAGAHTPPGRLHVQAANVGDCTAVLGAPGARWLGDDETEAQNSSASSAPPPQSPATGPASPLTGALMSSSGHTTLVLTQDHKVATPHERERLRASNVALRPTESRLYGLALARVLGDHFLKTDVACGLIAEPFVSRVAVVDTSRGGAFAVAASDGLWDVTTPAAAVQMAAVAGAGGPGGGAGCDAAAAALLAHARQKRSKDDCTVLCVALS